MKFSIKLKKSCIANLFKHRFDYINMQITNTVAVLFAEDTDLLVAYDTPVFDVFDYVAPLTLRVPKKVFISLISDEDIVFNCSSNIDITFFGKDSTFNMSFEPQICYTGSVNDKLKLIFSAHEYPKFPVFGLKPLIKVLHNSSSPLVIESGYAFASYSNAQLYMKTICDDCAVFPASLSYLLNTCEDHQCIYDVKNFIIATSNHSHVMINKAIAIKNSDIAFINKAPVIFSKTVTFSPVRELMQKIRDYSDFKLDLILDTVSIESDGCILSTSVAVNGGGTVPDSAKGIDVSIASNIVKGIIYSLKSDKVQIAVSKHMVRLYLDNGIMVVC